MIAAVETLAWVVVGSVVGGCVLFLIGIARGARMVRNAELALLEADPADQMSPALRAGFAQLNADLDESIEQALAIANSSMPDHPTTGRDRWERLIDPGAAGYATDGSGRLYYERTPEYNALAEWAANIDPSLRRKGNAS